MPKVSVIIPIYNVERYLRQCLDSVINQTLKDIEIICVNDGSTDNSLEILEDYAKKDSRIKIITKENGGLSSARNVGIANSSAEYLGFVDSDDYIDITTYEKAYNVMLSNNVDLVIWGAKVVKDKGLKMKSKLLKSIVNYHSLKFKGKQVLTNNKVDIYSKMPVTVWNKLFKKDIIIKNGLKFPDGFLFEDNDFFTKYFLLSKTAYFIDEYLYCYLQRNNSIMANTVYNNNTYKKIFDYITVYNNIWDFAKSHNLFSENIEILNYIFDRYLISIYSGCPDKDELMSQLLGWIQKLDNDVLKNPNITYIKDDELYKNPKLNIKMKSIGNHLFGCDFYINKKIYKFFGIKLSVKNCVKQVY